MKRTPQLDDSGSRRVAVAGGCAAVVLVLFVGACGTTDQASREPLPPIRTTTSTTTIPGTTLPEGVRTFYEIKRGDTLGKIAAAFNVTVQSILELNGIENQDSIQAGQTLEIPTGIVVVDELPDVSTTDP